ncbi:MBL fold metallo-hydrolase [Halalkaliarchaeum sp. AArc-GB]|uniref:MBL fold metallo-hydrolase n=1 Tax=unclassified Halalkaliarchaeum TaxID=2678344 RepID=UPI00217E0FE3|nr:MULTISPECIES: MBL fold metallo-hydrolase [unclassified Halalkaliarchaeum]MDR5672166.1 MBL fold metallo-hydrolase [Halalkaliarchaeum sp. AArc-GB]
MARGELETVPETEGIFYYDTGMYDADEYGSVYVVDAEEPAVIDTGIGTNREGLFDAIEEALSGRDPAYVLPTHAHLDHAGGAGYLARRYPDATVLAHERAVPHLIDPERLVEGTKAAVGDQWNYYVEPAPVPEDRIEGLEDGDAVDLGDRTIDVHEAPGHAPHQVVFHDRTADAVFTGDAAGIYVRDTDEIRVTSPPPQFHAKQCIDDVKLIQTLEPELLCFGHFGPREYDEGLLDEYKRSLVEWVEAVKQKRRELGDDDAVIDHFVKYASIVDAWGEEKSRAEVRLNTRGAIAYLEYVGEDA